MCVFCWEKNIQREREKDGGGGKNQGTMALYLIYVIGQLGKWDIRERKIHPDIHTNKYVYTYLCVFPERQKCPEKTPLHRVSISGRNFRLRLFHPFKYKRRALWSRRLFRLNFTQKTSKTSLQMKIEGVESGGAGVDLNTVWGVVSKFIIINQDGVIKWRWIYSTDSRDGNLLEGMLLYILPPDKTLKWQSHFV